MTAVYDSIGTGYAAQRRPDPRIAAFIDAAIGPAASVVNIGAGAGSYEPSGRSVVAVEPSAVMIGQRPPTAGPAVRGVAEAVPVRDGAFDVAMAVLTIHHWPDPRLGLAEMRRVATRQVVVTFDWDVHDAMWFVAEYLPEVSSLTGEHIAIAEVADALDATTVRVIPVAFDTPDATLVSHWRRPEAYLDARVRAASSGLALLPADVVDTAVARLRDDLESGAWARRHADLVDRETHDVGLRLVAT